MIAESFKTSNRVFCQKIFWSPTNILIGIKCTFCFLGRPGVRNAIFAPAKFNSYAGSAFPGISDLLHEIDDLDEESKSARWKEIRRHLSDLMIMIQEAERFLRPVAQV